MEIPNFIGFKFMKFGRRGVLPVANIFQTGGNQGGTLVLGRENLKLSKGLLK